MSIIEYTRTNRKTVYLVQRHVNGKIHQKTFPLTPEGLVLAKQYDAKLDEMYELYASINKRRLFKEGKIRGLNLNLRKNRTCNTVYFRIKITIGKTLVTGFKPVRSREEFPHVYEEAVKEIRDSIGIDTITWLSMRSEINKAYFIYLKEYCQLTGEQF
jgi:hypothetical protein